MKRGDRSCSLLEFSWLVILLVIFRLLVWRTYGNKGYTISQMFSRLLSPLFPLYLDRDRDHMNSKRVIRHGDEPWKVVG